VPGVERFRIEASVTRRVPRPNRPRRTSVWIGDDSLGDYENAFSGQSVSRM
jgi:hypothetical protein